MRNERGFALIITLVITALLVALATEFIHDVYVDTSAHRNAINIDQASLMADAGVNGGVAILKQVAGGQSYSSLLDFWAKPLELEDEKGKLTVTIEEENGKIDLNSVTLQNGNETDFYAMLRRLLGKLQLPGELADSVADWVDENNDPRPGGAENGYYQQLQPPYQAKNSWFASGGELGLVKGFSPAVMNRLGPFVTIDPQNRSISSWTVNINTAPKELLESLDDEMSPSLAQRILDYRKTTPFKSAAELAGKIAGMEKLGQKLQGRIGVKGSLYRIVSTAKVGDTVRIIEAAVRLNGTQATFLYWREY